ncbi:MAG: Ger(x)C family spore germination C-terminal domain-containing protein, partial [Clostridium sp.]
RKVVCKKKDNKFFFDIYIEASGKIVNNNYMNNLSISLDQKYALEKRIATHYETSLQSFVDNMKSYYKVDLLDLGFVAASKYGRNLISDWDETVTTSPIKVHFKFSIDEFGIGNMTF